MTKHAQHQGIVSVEALPGYWVEKTGGDVSADPTMVWDVGSEGAFQESLSGRPTAENVVTARPFDLDRDLPELKALRRQVGKLRTTIKVQYTDANGYPVGEPTVYADALLVTMTEPPINVASTDASTLTLTWAVSSYV